MRNGNIQITPKSFELFISGTGTDARIGLRFNVHQGYANMLDSFTFPIDADAAFELGANLVARSDALSGRPERDWHAPIETSAPSAVTPAKYAAQGATHRYPVKAAT